MVKLTREFQVTVFSPFETFYNGPAVAVTAESSVGKFDILYGHANFLSLLVPCEVKVRTVQEEKTMEIKRGILQVADNTVWLFANI